ncbi:hypothetical protein AB9P05_18445 [Roseivirga sp. BDSF3-8]|uniref:hypothetical protein n=1 Tax=Roseivirga sp. BDSF3-8 TaxID=3241598 RepID=UPI0035327971
MKDEQPSLAYWHVWTDDDGVSHQSKEFIYGFEKESMGGDAAAQWNKHLMDSAIHVMFAQLPVGWVGEWHENPQPQWIIPLSGKWFVETQDGTRVEMGPGDLSLGADQNTQPNEQGHRGHKSGTVGDSPARLMIIQLKEDKWTGIKPGQL